MVVMGVMGDMRVTEEDTSQHPVLHCCSHPWQLLQLGLAFLGVLAGVLLGQAGDSQGQGEGEVRVQLGVGVPIFHPQAATGA
jgi:hypothetical protein